MNIAEALRYKVFFMGAPEDDFEHLEIISTLQKEVLRLREDKKKLKKQIKD